jgi:hypothetical protein
MTIAEQVAIADGHRFQQQLADFVAANVMENILEIGSGVSSVFILQAFDEYKIDGTLHSIDTNMWYSHEILHDKFNPIKGKSIDKMIEVFLKYGAPDLLLSDGCHEIKDMTYEYEFGFAMLKPNGYLIADDTSFGNNGAWEKFLSNHELTEHFFGDARMIQKPSHIPVYATEEYHKECILTAENDERIFLEKGGKLSEVKW